MRRQLFAKRVPFGVPGVYPESKSAPRAFTQGLACELGPQEITVTVVRPGSIDTDVNQGSWPFAGGVSSFIAAGHYGTGEDLPSD